MKALVVGATGLVGSNLLAQLEADARFFEVFAFVRSIPSNNFNKIKFIPVNFNELPQELMRADVVFCALGTTLKKAGSKENQHKIDVDIPFRIASAAKNNGTECFALVSSIGANVQSSNFYLHIKGKLEDKIRELQFAKTLIIRPSILLGKRNELRPGERLGIFFVKAFGFLLLGKLKKYRGVKASAVARCMINEVQLLKNNQLKIMENDEILNAYNDK